VIGGGLPVAAYGGRREIMERIAPAGPVYQAGTLSGNPLAMAAGIATLTTLTPALHSRIEKRTAALVEGLQKIADDLGIPLTADCAGSMWGFFFSPNPVRNFTDAKASDTKLFSRFFHALLERGVYLAPSPFEACFMSAAHSDDDVAEALHRMRDAMGAAIA
jgi:glutamate-1-semialdehyde 2,1-aminomutase